MKRKQRKKNEQSPMWNCPVCIEQMVGGTRCMLHNPTPEQRAAQPERYHRAEFAPHRRDVSSRKATP